MNKLTIALAVIFAVAAGSTAMAKPYHATESGISGHGQWYASDANLRAERDPNPADF